MRGAGAVVAEGGVDVDAVHVAAEVRPEEAGPRPAHRQHARGGPGGDAPRPAGAARSRSFTVLHGSWGSGVSFPLSCGMCCYAPSVRGRAVRVAGDAQYAESTLSIEPYLSAA
ncbi:hypothetical protein GCM10010353_30550 [Streptomyces chryseus]|nr:hypothetical protein GCM10010353_30550 [Streptomyces chryseus]